MKIIRDSSEAEMVAIFLGGEINSPRWGKDIEKILSTNKIDRTIIVHPDITNGKDNLKRAFVLGESRGFGKKDGLFDDLSEITTWKRIEIGDEDFPKIRYIDYDYWVNLSGGSRLVIDGVKNIKKGIEIFNKSNRQFIDLAKKIENGYTFPELILKYDKTNGLTLLEGHVRLTAYLLVDTNPKPLEVIVGFKKI